MDNQSEQNEFFRNATLKICGNLVLEEALHATLRYVKDWIPAMILYRDEPLRFEQLGRPTRPTGYAALEEGENAFLELDDVVERHIRRALERTGGKIHGEGGAGELLGVNPNTLRNKMRKLGIPFSKGSRKNGML